MTHTSDLFSNIMLFCINNMDLSRLSIILHREDAENFASLVATMRIHDNGYCLNASSINYTIIANLSILESVASSYTFCLYSFISIEDSSFDRKAKNGLQYRIKCFITFYDTAG